VAPEGTAPEQFQMYVDTMPTEEVVKRRPLAMKPANLCRRRGAPRTRDSPMAKPSSPLSDTGLSSVHAEVSLEHKFSDDPEACEANAACDDAAVKEEAHGLLLQFQAGGKDRETALDSFKRMSFASKVSSRAAQLALKGSSANHAAILATGLHGHVRSAVTSKFANFVVQEIMAVVPVARASFIVEELVGFGLEAAHHRTACRVLCRIVEHESLGDGAIAQLLDEVLAGVKELCIHDFGAHVIRHILEFGMAEHRHQIAEALCTDVMGYATHNNGSLVVEDALKLCAANDQHIIVSKLIAQKDDLFNLAKHKFGRHVVKALLSGPFLPLELRAASRDRLKIFRGQLRGERYGKSVLRSLGAASS